MGSARLASCSSCCAETTTPWSLSTVSIASPSVVPRSRCRGGCRRPVTRRATSRSTADCTSCNMCRGLRMESRSQAPQRHDAPKLSGTDCVINGASAIVLTPTENQAHSPTTREAETELAGPRQWRRCCCLWLSRALGPRGRPREPRTQGLGRNGFFVYALQARLAAPYLLICMLLTPLISGARAATKKKEPRKQRWHCQHTPADLPLPCSAIVIAARALHPRRLTRRTLITSRQV